MSASSRRYALGLDFGTESVRALAVDCDTAEEVAVATAPYAHGVIVDRLPGSGVSLPPGFALQRPRDYLDSAERVIASVLAEVKPSEIVGVGVDFTACTMLPVKRDGTPLCDLAEHAGNPHAWTKLWKHHAAQPESDRATEVARARAEPFLRYYGGTISCEWLLPKCLEILGRAPEIYRAAELFVEAGDWMVQQLTGNFTRNACAAGYKGLWSADLGFPSRDFLAALGGADAPDLLELDDKWLKHIVSPGTRAGEVSARFAATSGLVAGTPVSAATIDAHSGVPGMGVFGEGVMSSIMGTSTCHMVLASSLELFEGYAGVVLDGIVPGLYGYESGQAAVGDLFTWFARRVLGSTERDPFAELSRAAATLAPGQTGLVALDWLNGNRSILMDAQLSGLVLGLTLDTRPHEIYRALIEATAYGARTILESYRAAGIEIDRVVVCGGLADDPLIMQIYADVLGVPIEVAASRQAVALGAAIFGSLAAGEPRGFASLSDAVAHMTRPCARTFQPTAQAAAVYGELYQIHRHVHDHFGREHGGIMKRLRRLRRPPQPT